MVKSISRGEYSGGSLRGSIGGRRTLYHEQHLDPGMPRGMASEGVGIIPTLKEADYPISRLK